MKLSELQARDGVTLPISWFPAENARCVLIFLPALGIQCRFYDRLASLLCSAGCSVCLMEQRGHGRSPLRASRSVNWGYDDYLQNDIPAMLEWVKQQPGVENLPLIMGGHSLGGHLSTIWSGQHPDDLQGVLHIACGSPYYADFAPLVSFGIRILGKIIKPLSIFPGYFPGSLLGFAGRESLQLMRDWRFWASTGRLDYGSHKDLHDNVARFSSKVLAISMAGDKYSSRPAEQRALAPFTGAKIRQVRIGSDEGGDHPGHFAWAKKPGRTSEAILDWLQSEFSRPELTRRPDSG